MRAHAGRSVLSKSLFALVGVVSGSVMVVGLPVLPAAAGPLPQPHMVDQAADALERPDAVAAMVTARSTGQPVEDLSQRSETGKVFANPDGSWTAESAPDPIQVQDADGGWHPIDTTLVPRAGGVGPAHAAAEMVFSAGGDKTFARVTESGRNLAWKWSTVLPEPLLEGNTATYPGAFPGGDLVVRAQAAGFSHEVVLHQPPAAPVEIAMPVLLDGTALVQDRNGSLSVETPKGRTLVEAPQPLMWDSSADSAGQPAVRPVDTSVTEATSGKTVLTLSPDDAFLSDPGTEYPVVIDPSFTTKTTGDTWVQNAGYTSSQVSSLELRAGTYDGGGHKARSYLRFGDGAWKGTHVTSAILRLRNFYSGSCTGSVIRVKRITEDWRLVDATFNFPAVGSTDSADYKPAHGYNSSCPNSDADFDVTGIVDDWAQGRSPNYGLRIKAEDESSNFTWRKYRSVEFTTSPAHQPKLMVTYNSFPDKVKDQPSVSPGNAGYVTTAKPTLKATVSDPDKGKLRADFQVLQNGVEVWSKTSEEVSSGSAASVTVPAGVLLEGQTYNVKVKGNDGVDVSKNWSPINKITVDTTKPTVESVTATAYADGQWTAQRATQNLFTFSGPADTSSFSYWLDDGAKLVKSVDDASGTATISWAPGDGFHKVTVVATDKAGNSGTPAKTFVFGVGQGGLEVPRAEQRSTGAFPLQASAAPGASSATFSWRYADKPSSDTWHPVTGVTTSAGEGWTGSVTESPDGRSVTPSLLWDASAQRDPNTHADPTQQAVIKAPARLELRVCFEYAASVCTDPLPVQLVPSAFGGNYPISMVGPATVALFTGEMSLTEPDAVDTAAGVGRTFASYDRSTSQLGPFGPGWSTALLSTGDTTAELLDHRAKDRTFVLVSAGGASETFLAEDPDADLQASSASGQPTAFRPAGVDDDSRLELTIGTETSTVTLTRPYESRTTWQKAKDEKEWVLQAAQPENTVAAPTTDYAFDPTGFPTWIAQTEPGTAATCTASAQTAGCRGLKITYSGTGDDRRATAVERIAAGAVPETLATYSYTVGRLLDSACGPDPDGSDGPQQPLCTSYAYDTTTVSGRTLLAEVTPAGQQPWQFTYDDTGRLSRVTRPLDTVTTSGTGPATWTIVYDLDPTSAGLPDLTAASAARWGQTEGLPTQAFAVFNPAHVPAAGTPTSSDLPHASVWYADALGTVTNTAVHGNIGGTGQWLVDTQWYDEHGNVVRYLDAAGRARALAAPADQQSTVADDASLHTVYNEAGDRIEDHYGPVHEATLKDGSNGPYRAHTAYIYDDEAPTLGGGSKPALPVGETAFNLVVETRSSAALPDRTGEKDVTVVRNEYDPVVAGDGNGWELGTPTRVRVRMEDGSWSTSVSRYDTAGQMVETRQPGGGSAPDGAGSDGRATVMSYYGEDATDPDCKTDSAAREGWAGLPCKTGPAGQPTGPTMPVTYHKGYNQNLQPTLTQERSPDGSQIRRTTEYAYDALGRVLSKKVTVGQSVVTTTTGYHPTSGFPETISGTGGTVKTAFDTWGRLSQYTDATDLVSTTRYTVDGQVASFDDGTGTYTYSYDQPGGEHRGLPTGVDIGLGAGVADSFTLAYDAAGAPTKVTYPNGMVATHTYDEAGVPVGLAYADGAGQALLGFTATVDVHGRVLGYSNDASAQRFGYDALGRLTKVEDTRDKVCTTRSYAFSAASERTGLTVHTSDTDDGCQATTLVSSWSGSYDTANRLRNTGYDYDDLGRTLSVPAADTAAGGLGALTAAYHANDMVAALTQTVGDGAGGTDVKQNSYGLDPAGRINAVTTTVDGSETTRLRYRFADHGDAPVSIQSSSNGGSTWSSTRYVTVPGMGMAATVAGNGTLSYQLANLHGDVVATQTQHSGPLTIDSYAETDEYGNPIDPPIGRYGYLGKHQRSTDTVGGMTLMGARAYNPTTGLFLSVDPILNGGANRFAYPTDSVNMVDLSGEAWWGSWHVYRGGIFGITPGIKRSLHIGRKGTVHIGEHGIASWVKLFVASTGVAMLGIMGDFKSLPGWVRGSLKRVFGHFGTAAMTLINYHAWAIQVTAQNAMSRRGKCMRITFYFLSSGYSSIKSYQEDC